MLCKFTKHTSKNYLLTLAALFTITSHVTYCTPHSAQPPYSNSIYKPRPAQQAKSSTSTAYTVKSNSPHQSRTHTIDESLLMKLKTFYQNKKVLVTGGCGFIGSHIAKKLVELGAHVTIMDNLSTGFIHNIETITDQINLLELDVRQPDNCLQATQNQDVIFHLAAFISVPDSIKKPDTCYKNNVEGTFNMLHAAHMNNVKKFIFSSSAAVYGPYEGICSENSTPCKPNSPYGFSKLIGEQLCAQYRTNFNIATVALRYFNVWGAGQNPSGAYAAVVAKFSENMAHNLPITIFGDGMQTRDFVHVSKIAEANLLLGMLADTKNTHSTFNIGTGTSINLLELIDKLKAQFPEYDQPIQFLPARLGDVQHSSADCTQYQSLFNMP